jgi:hypothetical protein
VGRHMTGQIEPDGLNWADGQPRRDLPRFCRRGHKKEGFFRIACFGRETDTVKLTLLKAFIITCIITCIIRCITFRGLET